MAPPASKLLQKGAGASLSPAASAAPASAGCLAYGEQLDVKQQGAVEVLQRLVVEDKVQCPLATQLHRLRPVPGSTGKDAG